FAQGVSRISQMSGKDHRDLMRTQVAVVAGGPNDISARVTQATQAVVDCIYLAQYDTMTDGVLQAYEDSYLDLQNLKQAWIENETRKGKRGVIEHFNIPKMHNLRHLSAHVRAKGPPDNYSTETMERLHIVLIKDAYRATNRRNWAEQATRWLTRHETIVSFASWLDHSPGEPGWKEGGIPEDFGDGGPGGLGGLGNKVRIEQVTEA
ncbi:hypothetical protein BDV93DRAFT_458998, partial [Ceratobasidium sp. AG-I]